MILNLCLNPIKFCILDPLPACLLRLCLDDLTLPLPGIINAFLSSAPVPDLFKDAVVKPLLEKRGLDAECLKNYHPIKNLPFLSKLLQRVVLFQLQHHLASDSLHDTYQLASKKNHSIETALFDFTNRLFMNTDRKLFLFSQSVLVLSTAFDTLDLEIFLKRLHTSFGIMGQVLRWLSSYLSDRHQSVAVDIYRSRALPLKYGVLQGFVPAPVLFTLYDHLASNVIIISLWL